jgi:pimeloyl-ACP methyl ester carboxylesterase
MTRARLLVALLALVAIGFAGWHLRQGVWPLLIETVTPGGVPVTIFRPGFRPVEGPVVVIAHGFAGSQQLMLPLAVTLARQGHVVVTFDFPGHGRNAAPLPGGIRDDRRASAALLAALGTVEAFARQLPRALPGGRDSVLLLGHSMGGDIVLRHAVARGEAVAGTIAISSFGSAIGPGAAPRNLLAMVGGWEPAMLRHAARRMAASGLPEGADMEPGITYGRFADGSARRLAVIPGVEHIAVLYGAKGLETAALWADGVAGRAPAPVAVLDARGPWIGLLILGLVMLAWPLAALLPRADRGLLGASAGLGAGLGWRRLWWVALLPAVATPLVLRLVPTQALPLLLGDYVAAHCALYGLLTALCLWRASAPLPWGRDAARRTRWWPVALGGAALAAYGILGIGTALDTQAMAFWPVGPRWWLIGAIFAGVLPFFLADEWLTRGPGAAPFAYAATKLCFLLSLGLAIALDPQRLFFLIIILPVILLLFAAFGRFSAWAWGATGHPWIAALGHAAILAWAIGTTFPLVAR